MLDILLLFLNRYVTVGFFAGLAAALLFHRFAPAGTDTATAGAWFIGLSCVGGFVWSLTDTGRGKR